MRFRATVEITGLSGISDPEGQTIERALPALGFEGIEGVHVGKLVRFDLEAPDADSAKSRVTELCARLLANPVIEEAHVRVDAAEATGRAAGVLHATFPEGK